MKARQRRVQRQDLLIVAMAFIGVAIYVAASMQLDAAGFPLDDAWIHQSYARNLAERGEWALIAGTPTAASTAPLFTAAVAIGYAVSLPHFGWTFLLGALALALGGCVARRIAAAVFPDVRGVGLATGLATVTMWHLVWAAASGMETALFASLTLVLMWAAWGALARSGTFSLRATAARGAGVGLLGAALTATRPEGVVLMALVMLGVAMSWPRQRKQLTVPVFVMAAAAACAVAVAPYLALNVHLSGSLLPDTAAAKQAEFRVAINRQPLLSRYAQLLLPLSASSLTLLAPGFVHALWGLRRRVSVERRALVFFVPLVWTGALVGMYAMRLPVSYQHGRYVIPILPSLLLYGVGGTMKLAQAPRRSSGARVLTRTLALSALVVTGGFWWIGARQYAEDVRIINSEMVATAKWVEANLPADELLAVHDIGALSYFAPRPILDLAGLVSPEVVPIIDKPAALMQLLCERDARYLMVLPDQRPARADDPRLGTEAVFDAADGAPIVRPLFTTDSPYATEAAGYQNNMMVYQLNWQAGCD